MFLLCKQLATQLLSSYPVTDTKKARTTILITVIMSRLAGSQVPKSWLRKRGRLWRRRCQACDFAKMLHSSFSPSLSAPTRSRFTVDMHPDATPRLVYGRIRASRQDWKPLQYLQMSVGTRKNAVVWNLIITYIFTRLYYSNHTAKEYCNKTFHHYSLAIALALLLLNQLGWEFHILQNGLQYLTWAEPMMILRNIR